MKDYMQLVFCFNLFQNPLLPAITKGFEKVVYSVRKLFIGLLMAAFIAW
jgi:hypothetical protein